MRKLISILFVCLLAYSVKAQTTYYVATTGNDLNPGTIASPRKSVSYTASQCIAGDNIYVNAGTYTEPLQIVLPVNVSIHGADSATTILKLHYNADWNSNNPSEAAITLSSAAQGTEGGQSISNLTIDGDNLTAALGILIRNRSHVTIYSSLIKDFNINGICYMGAVNPYTKPSAYSVGNELYNCTITNCTGEPETYNGGGLINMSGQKDLYIHNNNFSDTSRAAGFNGDIILGNGYGIGFRYMNNVSYKPTAGNHGWNFHLEMPNEYGGAEISGNVFNGGDCDIDIGTNYGYDHSYAYNFWIHHNTFIDHPGAFQGNHDKTCLDVEGESVSNVLIEHNKFDGIVTVFVITDGYVGSTHDSNIVFRNNLGINIGLEVADQSTPIFNFQKSHTGGLMEGVSVINNTMIPRTIANTMFVWFTIGSGCTLNNITFGNNIIMNNQNTAWAWSDNAGTFDSLTSRNNIIYNNANSNNILFTGNSVTHYINAGNINSDPLISLTDGSPQTGSPAIGAAYPYGYGSDIGGVQSSTSTSPPTVTTSGDQTFVGTSTTVFSTPAPAAGHIITSYLWTKVSGGSATITSPNAQNTDITGLAPGSYQFQILLTQDDGQTATAVLNITVNAAAAPTANAGSDQTITLPTDSISITGSATVSSGQTASYLWTKVSGSGAQTIAGNTTLNPTFSGFTTAGTYVFELKVSQTDGQFATDDVTITVADAAAAPPTVSASADQTVTGTSTTVSSTPFPAPGHTIISYLWTKVSGGSATITSPDAQNTGITGLAPGTYQFQIEVTQDDAQTATDNVTITVAADTTTPPSVTIYGSTLISDTITTLYAVAGAAPGHSVTSYSWTKVSGGNAVIVSPSGANTVISGLANGSYVFQVAIMQDDGQTTTETINITVSIFTAAPANPGNNLIGHTHFMLAGRKMRLISNDVTMEAADSTSLTTEFGVKHFVMNTVNLRSINSETTSSYILDSTDAGKVITLNNAGGITLVIPGGLKVGFNCTVVQTGAGQITFTASGATLNQSNSYTKTAKQYAVVRITSYAADTYVLDGEMQ